MSNDTKHFPWNEGQPTKPDVDALLKAFPPSELIAGARIAEDDVRSVISAPTENRFRTVYTAWINRLEREHNVILWKERNRGGFVVPKFGDVSDRTHPTILKAGRTFKKQIGQLALTKAETDAQRTTQEHQGRLLSALHRETKKARLNVLPSALAPEHPKITPPKKDAGR